VLHFTFICQADTNLPASAAGGFSTGASDKDPAWVACADERNLNFGRHFFAKHIQRSAACRLAREGSNPSGALR
jgi:hypothetical protein